MTEIPPVKPVVTEYQRHRLIGSVCGVATRAGLPPGVPTGGVGPRVPATTALCTGAYHLAKRTTQVLLDDLLGVEVGLGTMANLEQATTQAVAEPVAEARASVQSQPAADADETGWREGSQRAWLWTAVTEWVTGFVVWRSRSGKVAQELLGEDCWGGGDGSLERLQLVSHVATAGVLGALVARYRRHDHARRALGRGWRGPTR